MVHRYMNPYTSSRKEAAHDPVDDRCAIVEFLRNPLKCFVVVVLHAAVQTCEDVGREVSTHIP